MSKTGFSTYINERFSGFDGRSEFQADDVADFPDLAMRLFTTPAMAHIVFSNCVGPVELKDKEAVHRDIERLKSALGDGDPRRPSWARSAPGQIAFNYPDQHYGSHEAVPRRARRRAVVRVQRDHRRRAEPADRLARHRDGGSLPLGGQQRRGLAHSTSARGRRAQRRARGHPARAGPPARVLGQLRRAAPQGRAARRDHRPGAARSTPARSTSRAPTRAMRTSGASSRTSSFPTTSR